MLVFFNYVPDDHYAFPEINNCDYPHLTAKKDLLEIYAQAGYSSFAMSFDMGDEDLEGEQGIGIEEVFDEWQNYDIYRHCFFAIGKENTWKILDQASSDIMSGMDDSEYTGRYFYDGFMGNPRIIENEILIVPILGELAGDIDNANNPQANLSPEEIDSLVTAIAPKIKEDPLSLYMLDSLPTVKQKVIDLLGIKDLSKIGRGLRSGLL